MAETEWVSPTSYPDLSRYKEIAIDLETNDPNLRTLGSGWARGDGYIIGASVAVPDGQWYFPIRHGIGPNLDPRLTCDWLRDVCAQPGTDYIFHNSLYDVGWLLQEGIPIKGRIVDTMVAAPLLDENRFSYALNSLGKDYLEERKDERDLREAAKQFGLDPKAEMWKLPAHFVGAYAEQDAAMTFRLWQRFKQLVISEDIQDILEMELKLLPIILQMRQRGVRIDLDQTEKVKKQLEDRENVLLGNLRELCGTVVDIWAAASIAKAFDALGLPYPRTEKTEAPSFTKTFLETHSHPIGQLIREARELNKGRTTFVDNYIKHQVKGRIHAELHPLRSDDGGTVTGRFSYSSPNLQQLPNPKRNEFLGRLIRGLFLPEEGSFWGSFDYNNQEPRLVVHYAKLLNLRGIQEFAAAYEVDPATDFHKIAAGIMGMERDPVKTINLGLFYGMGIKKLADSLGLDFKAGKELFSEYHEKIPFVRALSDHCMIKASGKGVIRTLLGRRCRFTKWEPAQYGTHTPRTYEAAYAEHGAAIKRSFTYRALNRLIQGSAADQTKKAMIDLHSAGILPMVQVHDELCVSVASPQAGAAVKQIMEQAVQLEVPTIAEAKYGVNWGEVGVEKDRPWTLGLKTAHYEQGK